jgi:hypothetical protein
MRCEFKWFSIPCPLAWRAKRKKFESDGPDVRFACYNVHA